MKIVAVTTLLMFCACMAQQTTQPQTQSLSQSKVQTKAPQKAPTAPTRSIPKSCALSFEAGVVMKSGDVKRIAREDFYLLDQSFEQILGAKNLDKRPADLLVWGKIAPELGWKSPTADLPVPEWSKHVISRTISDFGGKGTLTAPPGTYWLFSYATIGKNAIFWNLKVALTANQSITLDNHNAGGIF